MPVALSPKPYKLTASAKVLVLVWFVRGPVTLITSRDKGKG